jgi:hypothetical protein
LRDLGYVENRNIVIESRSAEGHLERLPDLAAELVRLKVDVLVTDATPPTLAAKQATRPYMFLRYQYWDRDTGRDRYARDYVPHSELARVRRWIRRARAETAFGWGQAGFLRCLTVSV